MQPEQNAVITFKQHSQLPKDYDQARLTADLMSDEWESKKMPEICSVMSEWRIKEELSAYANKEPMLLKQIEEIAFPFLKSLNVWGNELSSVEGMSRIKMPLVDKIWLWENNICYFSSLRKADWPNMSNLYIDTNKLMSIAWLSELNAVRLDSLSIEEPETNDYLTEDFRSIFKLQSNKLTTLKFQKMQGRCREQAIRKKFIHFKE